MRFLAGLILGTATGIIVIFNCGDGNYGGVGILKTPSTDKG